jgi:hypothetical protein
MAQNTPAPTVVGLFRDPADAHQALQHLKSQGLDARQVSVMTSEKAIPPSSKYLWTKDEVAFGRITGATAGGTVGIFVGILLGLAAMSIPGIGPMLSAETFVTVLGSALLGTAVGALLGALLLGGIAKIGLSDEQANLSSEGVKRGDLLVAIQTDEAHVKQVEKSLREANVADVNILQET